MNKQDLITRVETMLLYYKKQFETSDDLRKWGVSSNSIAFKNYHGGRHDQLMIVLEDVKQLLEEVKSLEVNKERKLVKVVEYYE